MVSQATGEKLWRLPLYEDYKEKIKSQTADVKNSGGRFGGVGASAMFLAEFVSYPWAHWDIAGMVLSNWTLGSPLALSSISPLASWIRESRLSINRSSRSTRVRATGSTTISSSASWI